MLCAQCFFWKRRGGNIFFYKYLATYKRGLSHWALNTRWGREKHERERQGAGKRGRDRERDRVKNRAYKDKGLTCVWRWLVSPVQTDYSMSNRCAASASPRVQSVWLRPGEAASTSRQPHTLPLGFNVQNIWVNLNSTLNVQHVILKIQYRLNVELKMFRSN